ncbi:dhh1 [Symbiodinium natans]|uniref:ATP-dependent RNA helicase n=1 Tax=Symbiodinium natans TaxID=878477 RepID=A0A812Q0D0_9DINO|nr:dhh1 [Symbiodinium natans]
MAHLEAALPDGPVASSLSQGSRAPRIARQPLLLAVGSSDGSQLAAGLSGLHVRLPRCLTCGIAAVAGTATMHRRRERSSRDGQRRPDARGRREGREGREGARRGRYVEHRKPASMDWGGVKVTGPAAEWLQSQIEMAGGEFEPSPIQQEAMSRIYDGESCCLHAPTGTGKTLCFLLPLLQRFSEEAARTPVRGLRFLILVPTAALQLQTAALARALLGPGKAENVTLLRRDADNTREPSNIVVATPRQIRDLLDEPRTQPLWLRALGQLDWVVVDEADKLVNKWKLMQRREAIREGRVLPAVALLKEIELQTTKAGRRDEWQLVGATATLSRRTFRNMKYSAGIDLALIRVPGSVTPKVEQQVSGGQYGDGTTSWPAKLRHRLRVPVPFRFPKVMTVAAKTIYELEAERVLVVLATTGYRGRAPTSEYGRSVVLSQLRFRLEDMEHERRRIEVISISEAVEAAAELWSSEGSRQRVRGPSQSQVIVASAQEIRGIHLDFIDAVVLIGDPDSISDYLHAAGRTCRYQPGSPEPEEGIVVSIVPQMTATKIWKWSSLSGFKVVEVPLRRHIKTLEPAERLLTARQKQAAAELDEALQGFDEDDLSDWDVGEPTPPPSVWS